MARHNAREHLFGDKIRLKKRFYVLRRLLAIRHIEQGMAIPPVEFERLVAAVAPAGLRAPIGKLLEVKRLSQPVCRIPVRSFVYILKAGQPAFAVDSATYRGVMALRLEPSDGPHDHRF